MKHCTILAQFALRYAELQGSLPHVQPNATELDEMAHRAREVMRLMEEYRRAGGAPGAEFAKVRKRPWEEMSGEDGAGGRERGAGEEDEDIKDRGEGGSETPQTTAEQDMEIIRTKRATSTAVAAGSVVAGQPKSKYRKRASGQRATPPGKCHSCNIRETPEWRRGPDGARTLCNACGLREWISCLSSLPCFPRLAF